jgi:IclR family transcriptional regulator, pca regulon regulatory protein
MEPEESTEVINKNFVQSLQRGLSVIEAFDETHAALGLSDVARRTGLTRATARRFLLTLVELGYMRVDGGMFSLRPRVLGLGYAYLSSLTLPSFATPYLKDLAEVTRESASLSVLDDDSIVYVAQVTAARPMAVRIDVGTRFPAYATGMGRILLAFSPADWLDEYLSTVSLLPLTPFTVPTRDELRGVLENVRRDGYAHVDQELDFSLRALAVPVRDRNGTVIAAMGISTHTTMSGVVSATDELLPRLRTAAANLEAEVREKATTAVLALAQQ